MSQFEFLRSVTIGQYLPGNAFLYRVDPRARMAAYFILVMAFTFSRRLEGVALGVGVVLLALWAGRIPQRYAIRGLLAPLPFLLILALLQVVFNAEKAGSPVLLSVWRVQITLAGVMAGVILLVRFVGLILALSLASFTLSTSEITQGLTALFRPLARLGLPVQDLVMMVQVTLRFLPMLAQTTERIAKAQASRGADWDARGGNLIARIRQVLPLVVPLFLSSLHRAETMALAMDARAYGSSLERTTLAVFQFKLRDGLVIAVAVLAAAVILFL